MNSNKNKTFKQEQLQFLELVRKIENMEGEIFEQLNLTEINTTVEIDQQ